MVSQTFLWLSIFAVSAAIVNSLGIFTIYKNKKFAQKLKTYLMCFAAGMLISTPLILVLPRASQKSPWAGAAALTGFMFMVFSNNYLRSNTRDELAFGITAAEGIGIHSLVDGVVYAISFQSSILVGVLASTGLVVHEFAEGIITYTVLLKAEVKEKTAKFYAFVVAALTTPLGAFIAYPLVSKVKGGNQGLLLGFVAGVLIYVSSSHLLPEARRKEKEHSIVALLAGVTVALFIVFTKI